MKLIANQFLQIWYDIKIPWCFKEQSFVFDLIQKWLMYINIEIQQQSELDFAVLSINVGELDSCTIDLRLILFMFKYKGEKWILYLTAVV